MPIAMFLIAIITLGTMVVVSIPLSKSKVLQRENSDYDTSGNTFTDMRGKTFPLIQTNYNLEQKQLDVETIETALIRTCKAVNMIAHDNNCPNWNNTSDIWSFVGYANATGSLDNASTGATSDTFSCAGMANFARGLYQDSLPASFVVGRGYYYDFTGMDDENLDPCGYTDIVRY